MFGRRNWTGGLAALLLTTWLALPSGALAQSPLLQAVKDANTPASPSAAAPNNSDDSLTETISLQAAPAADEVDLTWTITFPPTDVAWFIIQRQDQPKGGWATVSKLLASDTSMYKDATVQPKSDYLYRVVAIGHDKHTLATSDPVKTTTHYKNLVDVIEGRESKLTVNDFLDLKLYQSSINDIITETVYFIPKVLVAVILLGIFWLIYRMIRRIVIGSMSKAHVDPSIREMLGALIKWSIMGFGLVIACNQVGIEIAALLTGVSIIGLAIGFAAQETLANFIAGVVIFWDKPFKVGDWIIIDGMFGQILRVSFRSTRMLNTNGETLVMPNTYMLANRVANHSTHPQIRLEIPIGIAYKESIDKARAALLATVHGDERVCTEPPPTVVVSQCADSSVNLLFRIWVRDESVERAIYSEYLEKAKNALDSAHIEIPFPHMHLLLDNFPLPALNAITSDSIGAPN